MLCILLLQTGKLEGMPGRTLMEAFEAKVNGVLNTARDDAGKLNWVVRPGLATTM